MGVGGVCRVLYHLGGGAHLLGVGSTGLDGHTQRDGGPEGGGTSSPASLSGTGSGWSVFPERRGGMVPGRRTGAAQTI